MIPDEDEEYEDEEDEAVKNQNVDMMRAISEIMTQRESNFLACGAEITENLRTYQITVVCAKSPAVAVADALCLFSEFIDLAKSATDLKPIVYMATFLPYAENGKGRLDVRIM